MANWNLKTEVAAFEQRQRDYATAHSSWVELTETMQAEYAEALEAWEELSALPPEELLFPLGEAPEPPVLPPEPQPPQEPPVYTSSPLHGPQTVTTPYGPVLMTPPTQLMTAPDGSVFAVLPQDFGHAWKPAGGKP